MYFWLHNNVKRILLLITSIFGLLAIGNQFPLPERGLIESKSKNDLMSHRLATSHPTTDRYNVPTEQPMKTIFHLHSAVRYLRNLKFIPERPEVNSFEDIFRKLKNEDEDWNYYQVYETIQTEMFSRRGIMKRKIPLSDEILLLNDPLKINLYDSSDTRMTVDHSKNEILETLRRKRSIRLNEGLKDFEKPYPKNKLRDAFLRKDMNAVQKLLDVEFLNKLSAAQRVFSEEMLTFLLINYFELNDVPCEETLTMYNKKGVDKGDIDAQTTDLDPNYVIEIKCTKDIESADGEIIKNYDSDLKIIQKFIKYANFTDIFHQSMKRALNSRKEVMLLGLTIHRSETMVKNEEGDKKEIRYSLGSWLLLPYKYDSKNEPDLRQNINIAELRSSDPDLSQKAIPLFQ